MPFHGQLNDTDASIVDGTIANKELVSAQISLGGVAINLGETIAQPAFDLTNATNIGNASLVNSSVNYGGVTVSLGGADLTPAFNLVDAVNYPTSSLTGSITNSQLAGSISNDKLVNSTVSFGGVQLSLGGSDATPAFNLTDANSYGGALAGASDYGTLLRSNTADTFTGNLTTGADNHITFGPNTTWGSSLRVGGNGRTATGTEMASVVTTDGNLHLDAADSTNAT